MLTIREEVQDNHPPWRGQQNQELPQNSKIVATHTTDSPDVLIWDTETQPDRHAVLGAPHSRPDLILTGHQDNAEFALAMFPTNLLFFLEFLIEKSSAQARISQLFCGVSKIISQQLVEKAHDADLHCVDWNPHDNNLILTGYLFYTFEYLSKGTELLLVLTLFLQILRSADNTVHLFDRRNLTSNGVGSPIYKFKGHEASVLSVQWSPDKSSVFGSSAEDGLLNIWDYDRVGKKSARATKSPAGLFFQHAGHRDNMVDFHWNVLEPWTIVSVSGNRESNGGGGTLQIWRMSDLIYRPEDEVLTELENFKSQVFSCSSKP
ncbi:hypothetical protein Bca52824_089219 [Brassica carinata]|uniref:Uncharacterized protein n=1 Tax=Brassica carinata TaxID=52824 RepID=A0A8X7TRJ7_BRACI|nr:hypothetical protein Bca52824_089219 [Brassica carinata]